MSMILRSTRDTLGLARTRKFLLGVSGSSILAYSSYHLLLDSKEKRKVRVYSSGVRRFARMVYLGVRVLADAQYSTWHLSSASEAEVKSVMDELHWRTARRFHDTAIENGGLFIKFGQGLAALNHLLNPAYIITLSKLNDMALTYTPDETEDIFTEDFGKGASDIFATFDPKPIAAASIAQVFEAKLKSGEKVAVKMQYIDLQDRFVGDIWTIKFLMDIAEYVFPGFNFKWAVIELCDTLKQELDFINEGRNAEKCAEDLKGFDYVHVPKVHWEYTSKRVLTTEFIEACKIDDAEGMKSNGIDVKKACERMCRVFGYQIFQSGFVHADPHPGNLFVRKNPNGKGDIQLVILDHGLYQRVEPHVQKKLGNFWKSMILDEQSSMLRDASELGVSGLHDTAILAAILIQRPWYVNVPFATYFKTMDQSDFAHMSGFVKDHFNKVMAVLRAVPLSLLLVIRNINTIRSIVQTHGEPVNRYRIMTSCTVKNSWSNYREYLRIQYRLFLMDAKEMLHKTLLGIFFTLSRTGIPLFSKFSNLNLEVEKKSVLL